ncbi:FlxA-like family protein [Paenibacillus sp. WC2504]|uniref:FlxA-like family protein n=1 Tax=Paenibacillus sp. WC2504 TaxID=3461403 RepID=UPI0040454B75
MNISINHTNERTPGRLVIPTDIGKNDHPKTIDKYKRDEKKDIITISPQAHNMFSKNGGKKPIVERLMEYKQNILDRRNDYVSNSLEKGASPDEMKAGLEKIDKQIQDIDKQIKQLQQEELRKATGSADKNFKEDDGVMDKTVNNSDSSGSQDFSAMQLTSETMKALISTSNDVKQVKSVKMAQLTLESEALNWASDPARSERLKSKAAELDGKIIHTSQNAVSNLKNVIENSNEDIQPKLNQDNNISKPAVINGAKSNMEEDQKEFNKNTYMH